MLDSIGEMSIQELRSCYPVLSKVVYRVGAGLARRRRSAHL